MQGQKAREAGAKAQEAVGIQDLMDNRIQITKAEKIMWITISSLFLLCFSGIALKAFGIWKGF